MINKILIFSFLFLLVSQNLFSNNKKESVFVHYKNFEYSKEEIIEKKYDTIYLVAASPTSESVGSLGAHAFILLTHGDDLDDALAINYYAYHERLTTIEKMAKGATTGLIGYLDIRPFSNIAERYTIGQNRTLFLYKTNINKEYIPLLIDKFYEYKNSDLRYQFFSYNCSSLLGEVFESVLSSDEKSYEFPNLIMPGRLVYLFEKQDLLVSNSEKTISPSYVKLIYDNATLTKEEINTRHDFFVSHGAETSSDYGFTPFIPNFDNFESNSIFSEKVSKLYLGMNNLNASLKVSLFDNQLYEQRQSAVTLYDFKLFDTSISYNKNISVDKFTIIESGRYTKVNLSTFDPSTYFSIKMNKNNLFDINFGYGLSFGTLNSLFSIIPIVETNISNMILTLKIKSMLSLYFTNAFVLLNFEYPIYNDSGISSKTLNLKGGYNISNNLGLEASYDFLAKDYNVYLKYLFYPLIK